MDLRALVLLALAPLGACTFSGGEMQLYPVAGPIAEADPTLVIAARAKDLDKTSGALSFRLPGKRKCEGTWSSVAPKITSNESKLSLTLRGTGGKIGRSTEDVGGINSGEIYAVCSDGTRVQGTFIMGSGTQSGTGTATDTLGNRYKLLF
ncbi:hypothetical protein [Ostreiculturibacter nitratireducens]|uniref:hypothetical protein n=1 Tax=Ostreiculturibacter nitratireducens TaxID=3075226 RepID=UPI0031B63607